MAKAPPIPSDQRPFHGRRPDIMGAKRLRRDENTGLNAGAPSDTDRNVRTQGRQGNIRQNLTPQRRVQDR